MKNNTLLQAARTLVLSLVTTAGLAFAEPASAQNNNDISQDVRTEIERLNKQISSEFSQQNIGDIVDLYSDDATIIAPGGKKIQGRKSIGDYWYSIDKTSEVKTEIVELGGNSKIVYELGKITITGMKNGIETTTTADIMIIWKRMSDYNYKIRLSSLNNSVAVTASTSQSYEASRP